MTRKIIVCLVVVLLLVTLAIPLATVKASTQHYSNWQLKWWVPDMSETYTDYFVVEQMAVYPTTDRVYLVSTYAGNYAVANFTDGSPIENTTTIANDAWDTDSSMSGDYAVMLKEVGEQGLGDYNETSGEIDILYDNRTVVLDIYTQGIFSEEFNITQVTGDISISDMSSSVSLAGNGQYILISYDPDSGVNSNSHQVLVFLTAPNIPTPTSPPHSGGGSFPTNSPAVTPFASSMPNNNATRPVATSDWWWLLLVIIIIAGIVIVAVLKRSQKT